MLIHPKTDTDFLLPCCPSEDTARSSRSYACVHNARKVLSYATGLDRQGAAVCRWAKVAGPPLHSAQGASADNLHPSGTQCYAVDGKPVPVRFAICKEVSIGQLVSTHVGLYMLCSVL